MLVGGWVLIGGWVGGWVMMGVEMSTKSHRTTETWQ